MSALNTKKFSPGQLALNIILMCFALAAILPFLMLIIASITSEKTLLVDGYTFFPSKFSLESYIYLFKVNLLTIGRAYGITVFVTAVGTIMSLMVGPMMAYVLSRRDYNKRRALTFFVFFTMLFNGGLVPNYLMWTQKIGRAHV